MSDVPDWWQKPRVVTVLVDNPSWILPFAESLVAEIGAGGDCAHLARDHDEVGEGGICFLLGCTRIAPPEVLVRNHRNLVVHESDLPRGRGFAPLAWQILEGRNEIPVCLLEAADQADAGPVVFRDMLRFEGHELNAEMRDAQGRMTVSLCRRFLDAPVPPAGEPQAGEAKCFRRRTPKDSRIDPDRTVAEQFDLLRVVDNERYPAFFEMRGHYYRLTIEKADD